MTMIKTMKDQLLLKWGAVLAFLAWTVAQITANSVCTFGFYEPEQPPTLDRLKKF